MSFMMCGKKCANVPAQAQCAPRARGRSSRGGETSFGPRACTPLHPAEASAYGRTFGHLDTCPFWRNDRHSIKVQSLTYVSSHFAERDMSPNVLLDAEPSLPEPEP